MNFKLLLLSSLSFFGFVLQGFLLDTDDFTVLFPVKPVYQVVEVAINNEPVPLHLYILEEVEYFFVVSQGNYPQSVDLSNEGPLFDGVVNGILNNYGGTLIESTDIEVASADYHRQISLAVPDGNYVHAHLYLKDRILFQLIAKSSEKDLVNGPYFEFFSSFQIK